MILSYFLTENQPFYRAELTNFGHRDISLRQEYAGQHIAQNLAFMDMLNATYPCKRKIRLLRSRMYSRCFIKLSIEKYFLEENEKKENNILNDD